MWKRFLLLFFVFGLSASCFGASVNWNASIVDAEHGAPDGYRVYYGSASDQLTTVWDNGGSTVFDIPDTWAVGTYYFSVRAYNASGESGWATTPEGQTWVAYVKSNPPPVLPPEPARDVWIVFEPIEEPIMAVSRTGTVYTFSSSETGSQSVTVPNDATLAIVSVHRYNIYDTQSFSLNSVSFSEVLTVAGTFDNSIYMLVNPTTGAQTFTWQTDGDWGPIVILSFYSGVDTSTPVTDYDSASAEDGQVTTPSMSCVAGDLVYLGLTSYNSDPSLNYTGQTEITSVISVDLRAIAGTKAISSGTTTTGTGSSNSYPTLIAAVIKASGGGASAVPANRGNIGMMLGMSNSIWLDNDFLKPVGGN